jgi:hypothetical protein
MNFLDIRGTSSSYFQIQKGGAKLANEGLGISVRRADGTTYADLYAQQLQLNSNSMVFNYNAAGSGADWTYTVSRPVTGMTAAMSVVLPATDGTAGQVLKTDGANNWYFGDISAPGGLAVASLTIGFAHASAVIDIVQIPANAIITDVKVIVDTAFDVADTLVEVGVTGTPACEMTTSENDLMGSAGDGYSACHNTAPVGGAQMIQANFTKGTSTVGSCRVLVSYCNPVSL